MNMDKPDIEAELTDLTTAGRMIGISRQAISQHAQRGHLQIIRPGCASLVWIREVKALQNRLQSQKKGHHSGKQFDQIRKKIRGAFDNISAARAQRNQQIKAIKEAYRSKIADARDEKRRRQITLERDQKIRDMRRVCRHKVENIRKQVQRRK